VSNSDPVLARVIAARSTYTAVGVDDDVAGAWVRDRLAPGAVEEALDRLHVADLVLACGCAHGDPGSLRTFEAELAPVIEAAVRAAGAAPAEVDEATQRIRERLLVGASDREAKISGYRGDGPLRGWVRVCAVREVLSERRRRHPEELPRDADIADVLAPDPELELVKANASAEFRAAFGEALAELSVRDKNVLRYVVLDGLTGEEVARIHRVDRSTISRWLAKARQRLLQGTRRRLIARLRIDRQRFDSLMGLIASRLDVSLGDLREED
jgi:RNA polymerase sigma-70 factor (ECF subfamily)